jgi:hypothetical protein
MILTSLKNIEDSKVISDAGLLVCWELNETPDLTVPDEALSEDWRPYEKIHSNNREPMCAVCYGHPIARNQAPKQHKDTAEVDKLLPLEGEPEVWSQYT